MIVADTDVLIDYLSGKGAVSEVKKALTAGNLGTTVITRFELFSGARNETQRHRIEQLLTAIPSLNLDSAAADAAAEFRVKLEKSGNSIGMADSLIAGIVVVHGGQLLTRNRRHFERIPQLTIL